MRELGIKAQYIKPYAVTTIAPDFSEELENILDEQFNLMQYGVPISHIYGPLQDLYIWQALWTYIQEK